METLTGPAWITPDHPPLPADNPPAMTTPTVQLHRPLEWSVAARTMPGETVSGDLHTVVPRPDGLLLAVVDGLGHGEEATVAARIAIAVIEQRATEAITSIVQHCHRALQRTRGVVMTIMALDDRSSTLTTVGIGNVETMIFRADPRRSPLRTSILLRGGVVGYQLPTIHPSVEHVSVGDLIVFATDGVREDFADMVNLADSPSQLAEKILGQKFRGTDDGLVLVAKYLGQP